MKAVRSGAARGTALPRPRPEPLIPSINSKGTWVLFSSPPTLGTSVPKPGPGSFVCGRPPGSRGAALDTAGLTLIKPQQYVRDCSKCFMYMNRVTLQGRYSPLFSDEETEARRIKKIVRGYTAGLGQAGIPVPEAAFLITM